MVFVPTVRVDVAIVALCVPVLMMPVPSVVAPSMNVTVPPGEPLVAVTVAAKVTIFPAVVGFDDDANLVIVALEVTATFTTDEVLIGYIFPLLKVAVML